MNLKGHIDKIAGILGAVERNITVVLFFTMLLFMFVQVFFRYVLHLPLAWTEEALRFIFIVASFVGATVATKDRVHVEINFLTTIAAKLGRTEYGKRKILCITDILANSISMLFCAFLAKIMTGYTVELFRLDQISVAMELPMGIIAFLISVCLGLMSFHFLINLIDVIVSLNSLKKGA